MRIRETYLRRVIRDELRVGQLHEDAVATGGNLSGYTDGERQQIAKKVQTALQGKLVDSGALKAGDKWSLTVNIGKRSVGVGKKSGAATGLRNNEIKPALRAIADDSNILDRDKLRAGRRLKISVSDTVAKAVEVPDQSAPSVDRPRKPRKYDRTDCVKKEQEALGVTADGLWGPNTQRAWDAKYPGVDSPGPRDGSNLPSCKPEEENECPEGEEWPGVPYALDVCEPIKDEDEDVDEDEDAGPTNECKDAAKELREWMVATSKATDNPLLDPSWYEEMIGSGARMSQFTEDWGVGEGDDLKAMVVAIRETQVLMKKVYECNCSGPTGHQEAAKALDAKITSNADAFGDIFNPWQLFKRGVRIGVTDLYGFIAGVWNFFDFTRWWGDMETFDSITWSRAGLSAGWLPGFDPLGRSERDELIEKAAALDALDICGDDGEEFDMDEELPG